ncbi:MAG TPA: UvrD-helicase domain-containing protein [Gaiellales bacterium]|nr:UvrD-helicase domain-containing protein [Gaiellales bacterium]
MAVAPSLDTLNPQQREAVLCTEGPLLVVAGAGSGKTRVLTHRIAHLISEGLASPSEILAITFTNRAAAEMKERVEGLVGGRIAARMWVMTFHSACGRMLRRDAELIGYRSTFTIYDQADQVRLVKSCIEDLGKDPKRFVPRAVHGAISHAKDRLLTPDLYAERVGGYFEETVASVYDLYERRLSAANAMDFDDLIMKTVLLLERVPEARRHWQQAFRYVMVDEYQDTNHAQFRLVSILAEKHRNLAVVGDQDQSIYAFRGADIRNIAEFEQDFPNAVVIPLEQNYRSTQTILDAANSVIEHNRDRKPKRLWSDLGTGEPLRVVEAEDEHAEARYVAGRIQAALDDGASAGEIAVFYRMNAQSRVLEDLLTRQGIDYRVVGGPKFYERAEVKDLIAYLQVLDNPADEVSLRRIVNQPRRGIGSTSLDRLGAYARSLEVTLWDAVGDVEASPLGSAAAANVRRFGELIEDLRDGAHEAPVGDLMERVLTQTGYADMLQAERTIEAQGRLENLQELVGVAREFDQRGEDVEESSRLSAFLQEISLYTDQDSIDDDRGRVTLMTLHNAKGLEFPIVFMIGLEEGLFPHQRSLDEGNEGEERRLCYVGMTRAQRGLTLTYARARTIFGARGFNRASRFLDELPAEGVEWERQAPAWAAPVGGDTVTGAPRRAFQAPEMPRLDLSVGDEVAHATLGEGTVIALSGDGTVTVRFREDGSERRLVLGYAPLTKI